MKFCRFNNDRYGMVVGDRVADITEIAAAVLKREDTERFSDPFFYQFDRIRNSLPGDVSALPTTPIDSVQFLSPVRAPGKVIAAPVNYQAHVREMQQSSMGQGHIFLGIGEAGLFLKASSSLIGPSEGIALRFPDRRTDYEVELVVVIGKKVDRVVAADALSYVAGYCLGIDITLRGKEDRSFRKSIDTYSVMGPWITTTEEGVDPDNVRISLRQNGELKQDASTSEMVYGVAQLIEFAATYYTLYPGDVIFTGTPQGVGPIKSGDQLRAACPELGEMAVSVRAAR